MTRIERQAAHRDHAIAFARDLSEMHDATVWVYPVRLLSGRTDYWTRFSEHAETTVDGRAVMPIAGFRGGYPIFAILPL